MCVLLCFLYCFGHPPDLHSFPTRRSSDLAEDLLAVRIDNHGGDGASIAACSTNKMEGTTRNRIGGLWGTNRKDRKSTRLNSSHVKISYAVFCLKKKTENDNDKDEDDAD